MVRTDDLILDLERVFEKIQTAARDGQGGSAAYALDRLRLIEQYARIGLGRMQPTATNT